MNYAIEGKGPCLILLHGIGSNSKSWRRQLQEFSKRYTVVAWDAPGFGKSEEFATTVSPSIVAYTEALRQLLDSLQVHSAAILGHSFGGLVAQDFYRQYPDRVSALILADTTQGGSDPSKRLHMIRTMTPQELARERAPNLLSASAPREIVDEAITIMSEIRRPGYEFAARAMAAADFRGVLSHATVPLMMVWGAADTITPPWKQWPAGARVEIIPDAGHLCYLEAANAFNQIVIDFLRGVREFETG